LTMKIALLLIYSLMALFGFSQDLDVQPLRIVGQQLQDSVAMTQLGNDCSIGRNNNGDAVLSYNGCRFLISDHILFDEIEAAFWLEMNADGYEDLILETSWNTGHSSYQGWVFEEFKYTTIVEVHHGWFLFSFDYYVELNTWQMKWSLMRMQSPL
jgi:hypothetical protein